MCIRDRWTVKVETGYLALRNKAAYNESNEIGQLNTGDTVQVKDTSNDQYWYVYVPQLDKTGYVDRNYLTGGSGTTTPSMTVKAVSYTHLDVYKRQGERHAGDRDIRDGQKLPGVDDLG